MKRILENAKKAIQINTVSHQGNEVFSGFMQELMKESGLKVSTQHVMHSFENISKRQFNVIGILGDPLVDRKTKKGLLFSVPTDTQSAGILSHWTETGGNPWTMTIKDGRVYGLGTAHAKLDFLCKLAAIEKFRERKLRQPVYLVGTCGKELGMLGAHYLIKSMVLNPRYVLASEPTQLRLVHRHKGQWLSRVSIGYQSTEKDVRGFNRRVDLRSIGRVSSGAYPEYGSNAILQAVTFLKAMIEAGFEFRISEMTSGVPQDCIPDEAKVTLYLTAHQYEDFKRFFREYVRQNEQEQKLLTDFSGVMNVGVRFLSSEALESVFELLNYFKEFESDLKQISDPAYSPAYSTVNLGKINTQPGLIEMYLDIRLLPSADVEHMEKEISTQIGEVSQKFSMLKISQTKERFLPSLYSSENQEFLSLCQDALALAHLDMQPVTSSSLSEASKYSHAGYETLAFALGKAEGNSHCPNESILITDLEKAVFFYEKLIERVCL